MNSHRYTRVLMQIVLYLAVVRMIESVVQHKMIFFTAVIHIKTCLSMVSVSCYTRQAKEVEQKVTAYHDKQL